MLNSLGKGKKYKIAVGLSGGVDSAVTAMLLKNQGHDVTGVYLQCWEYKGSGCGGDPNRADAVKISANLGIKFIHLDFIDSYKREVIDYFYKSYESGLTPNPDILCNTMIKFGLFLEWALEQGFDYIATGHYAQSIFHEDCVSLFAGSDKSKDQSYFLYRLNQHQLLHALFPLGDMHKADVRRLAEKEGLSVYNKPDSTGICFVGDVDIREFLKERIQPKKGKVVLMEGRVIGNHDGVWFYTIGQRHGFELTDYIGVPLYVISKSIDENELVVGPIKQAFKSSFSVENIHWINATPEIPANIKVRVRNLGEFYEASLHFVLGTSRDFSISAHDDFFASSADVLSKKEIFGVAPGQSAVFYMDTSEGLQVLGGGIIK